MSAWVSGYKFVINNQFTKVTDGICSHALASEIIALRLLTFFIYQHLLYKFCLVNDAKSLQTLNKALCTGCVFHLVLDGRKIMRKIDVGDQGNLLILSSNLPSHISDPSNNIDTSTQVFWWEWYYRVDFFPLQNSAVR